MLNGQKLNVGPNFGWGANMITILLFLIPAGSFGLGYYWGQQRLAARAGKNLQMLIAALAVHIQRPGLVSEAAKIALDLQYNPMRREEILAQIAKEIGS